MRKILVFTALAFVLLAAFFGLWNHSVNHRKPASEGQSSYTCRIVTGYGTSIGRGETPLKAQEQAWETCGQQMIDQYMAQRGDIPEDVIDDLTTACVNLKCQ